MIRRGIASMIARRLTTDSSTSAAAATAASDIYVGRLKDTIRGVKLLSVSSCIVTSVAAPIIMATNSASVAANVTACAFAAFGLFTTGLLTWATSPYVIRMRFLTAERQFEVESLNVIARTKQTRFTADEIEKKAESRRVSASMRPFVSFGVKGKRQLFFVHPEDLPSNWQNKFT
jgi:hypothetical protein